MAARPDRTERLLNLVFCLMSAGHAVSRAQIRDVVAGYQDSPSDEAFERMFERDKDELRSMGIPVETVVAPSGEVIGYRISRSDYQMVDLSLTVDELHAISLAAHAWERAAFGPSATVALRKLEALDPDAVLPEAPGSYAIVETAEPVLLPLVSLIRQGSAIGFDYRKSGQTDSERRIVSPAAVVSRHGHWYLIGVDHDRDDVRVFRVSRMVGVPVAAGERRTIPAGFDISTWNIVDTDEPAVAVVDVFPGQGHSLRRRSSVPGDRLRIPYLDVNEIAGAIVAAGPAAHVLEPTELVAAVVDRLTRIVQSHGGR